MFGAPFRAIGNYFGTKISFCTLSGRAVFRFTQAAHAVPCRMCVPDSCLSPHHQTVRIVCGL